MKALFKKSKLHTEDNVLIAQAIKGDKTSLENLIIKHQNFIYNVALAMVHDNNDAADITQEVLIKVITKLSTFKEESNFQTWLYRIVKNHFLNMKRSKYEVQQMTFEDYGKELDNIVDEEIPDSAYQIDTKIIIEEAKLSCMKGMLLCLDREQRLIFIMGELFEFSDSIGSEIMEITKENFRVKLHRAKKQLYDFMDNKCGLVNKNNPCRCAKKTTSFIKSGYVDPFNFHFQKERIATVAEISDKNLKTYNTLVLEDYKTIYQEHPYIQSPSGLASIRKLLSTKSIIDAFNLG